MYMCEWSKVEESDKRREARHSPAVEESVRENVALPKALIQKKESQAKSIRRPAAQSFAQQKRGRVLARRTAQSIE